MFDLSSPLICLSCPGLLAGEGFANLPRTIPAVYSNVDLGLSPGKKSSKRGEKPPEKIPKEKIRSVMRFCFSPLLLALTVEANPSWRGGAGRAWRDEEGLS